jgi:tetratricopeptide (TPR) repeat protein
MLRINSCKGCITRLTSLIPFDFLKTVAVERGLSDAELEALSLALEGYSTVDIATHLGLSAIAIRKRLGEVYKKFQIAGSGPGKLAQLKHELILLYQSQGRTSSETRMETEENPPVVLQTDWGEAPEIQSFYGRTAELETLQQWVMVDRCRLVVLLGLGGIGKTALSVKWVKQVQQEFEGVVWRSLRYAPRPEELLRDLISQLFPTFNWDSSMGIGTLTSLLIKGLRSRRCLLVWDEVESLLQPGQLAGNYREGYQGYEEIFRRVGQSSHNSCLLLLSREEPVDLVWLCGETSSVRKLHLGGLKLEDAQHLIQSIPGFSGADSALLLKLTRHYDGHPLGLKRVAQKVLDLFNGNIAEFFKHNLLEVGDVLAPVLSQQFERLTPAELRIIYPLAIAGQSLRFRDLQVQKGWIEEGGNAIAILESLLRRSLLEKVGQEMVEFRLPPLVQSYLIDQYKEQLAQNFAKNPAILSSEMSKDEFLIKNWQFSEELNLTVSSQVKQSIARHFNQLGYKLYMEGELKSAKLYLKLSLQFNPDLSASHFNLGSTYEKLQDVELARHHYQKAAYSDSNPGYSAVSNLARLEILQGNHEQAIELIQSILERVEEPLIKASLYKNLGWAYFELHQNEQAKQYLLRSIEESNDRAAPYCLLAQIQEEEGDNLGAKNAWQNCLNYDSKQSRTYKEPWVWPELEIWRVMAYAYLKRYSN